MTLDAMRVESTQATAAAAPAAAATTGAEGAGFRAALDDAAADIKLRKGEKAEAVPGHRYVEVTEGRREGMYINTSGNARHGEAFVLVRRHGVEYHVYGSGKDREVVRAGGRPDPERLELRKGEELAPVEGRPYAEITGGRREGMYLNTSGNARHGEAFVIARKHGVEYHIYGSGSDRLVVALKSRAARAES